MYPSLANQKVHVPWPLRTYPAEISRPTVTPGQSSGEKETANKDRATRRT